MCRESYKSKTICNAKVESTSTAANSNRILACSERKTIEGEDRRVREEGTRIAG